ncbi:MAG: hypothetical protein KU28_01780 [Sulfurovum sp. PC08-66]|nr:MAG: hypothetical protein KU28_01780 [Sulfurovum sp. PC08-66]KIM12664.1 MAG: hypothetical protein KU37_01885 [Sulfuricurvum sp. PC08-66]
MKLSIDAQTITMHISHDFLSMHSMRTFLGACTGMLHLVDEGLIITHHARDELNKKSLLVDACRTWAHGTQMELDFFIKSLLHCSHYPLRISLESMREIRVSMHAISPTQIRLELSQEEPLFALWIARYFGTKATRIEGNSIDVALQNSDAYTRLTSLVGRKNFMGARLFYSFEGRFIATLFGGAAHSKEHYFALLECPVDAPLQQIRSNYKRLARAYHPDRIMHIQDEATLIDYTQKFQALQEAYSALKGA